MVNLKHMKEDVFKIIFPLSRKQPWLADKAIELQNLLYKDCTSEEHRLLVIELLDRFVHISSENFSSLINELAESIVSDPSLSDGTTQILSMTADYNADSGQYILYALKAPFERYGWRSHLLITNYGRSLKEYNRKKGIHKNIVLVDEFVGSGATVIGRVNSIKQQYLQAGIEDISIKVKVLVCSSVGFEKIKKENIDIESLVTLKRGISDCYDTEDAQEKLKLMDELELKLSPKYKDRDLPKHGYGGTESLYTRDDGNTPNSVFPFFWWPILSDNSDRKTLLIRAMEDA